MIVTCDWYGGVLNVVLDIEQVGTPTACVIIKAAAQRG